ncbi:MAG: dienelactone hydrolase family protein [Syntrophales bacterium]|nr:dienelactone hydrolase family protein [Syntrophales bacterium]MCK9390198.1 dienelactone hydrolase family protein [Syntrophales bacterium]
MNQKTFLSVNDKDLISIAISLPPGDTARQKTGVIIAHGAGNDKDHPLLIAIAEGLAEAGYITARFNFPYKEKGHKAPDRQEILEQTWIKVLEYLQGKDGFELESFVAVGKSLGGRVASQLVAAGRLKVSGLVFLGYPLHPPGHPEQLRDAHLYRISIPMLFFAGTRDSLCDMSQLKMVLKRISSPWDLSIIEGGNHSLALPASAGVSPEKIYANLTTRIIRWLKTR